jgi:hypothetical protein
MNMEADVDTQLAVLVNLIREKYVSDSDTKIMNFARIADYFTIDVASLVGFGQTWGNLISERDTFGWIAVGDAIMPALQRIPMVPMLRDLFFSSIFLRTLGSKPGGKDLTGQFLG